MKALFEVILYQPIFNIFVGLYDYVGDVGIVILLITILLKLVLYPLTTKSIQAQKSLTELQPKLEELKEKYKDNQQEMAQKTMELYKEHKVNPFGSCLPLLIQLPIFLALYWVLQNGLTSNDFSLLYPFVPNPGEINPVSFGLYDLSRGNIVLAFLAAASQYWQAKMLQRKRPPKKAGEGAKDEDMMAMMNKYTLYLMPGLTFIIGIQLPGGLALYWFLSTLLTALQQKFLFNKEKKDDTVIEGKIVE